MSSTTSKKSSTPNTSKSSPPLSLRPSHLYVGDEQVLRGSGDTATNRAILEGLEKALPKDEFEILKVYLGTFYGYQQTWILDPNRFSALVKCRQIGGSHAYSFAVVFWAVYLGETNSIISIGDREAGEVLAKCRSHLEALCRLGSKWAEITKESQKRVEVASGGRILALPSTSGARGYSGNVILDEFAFYTHPEAVYDAAAGSVMHGYRLRILSTPNGLNRFHDIIDGGPQQGWVIHQTDLYQAIEDGLPVSEDDCWRQAYGDPRIFGQLFLCEFLDDNLQYLSSDLVKPAFEGYPADPDLGVAYAGLDIGLTRDLTVLTIVRRDGDLRWVTHQESHKLTDDALLDRLVAKAFNDFKCRRLAIDATGLGSFPAQRLRRQWGVRLEPVVFGSKSKEDLATRLYDAFASHEIKLPRAYRHNGQDQISALTKDLYKIRRITTSAGNVRYDASTTKEGHADRAWSLGLALHAAGRQSKMIAAIKKRMQGGTRPAPQVANG